MRACKALVIGSVGALALAVTAHAADMPRYPMPVEKPSLIATEFVSGWYARADLGYRMGSLGSIDAWVPITTTHYDNTVTAGGGFGYKHKWLRGDLTFDYGLRARVKGDSAAVTDFYVAKLDTFTALANVYFDMGTWGGLTPYVGAGAGTSRLNITDVQAVGVIGTGPPRDVYRFSWAWMAGLSYQFTSNLALDVGYRYLHLGDAVSPDDSAGRRIHFRNLTGQEIRIGLRLLLD